MSFITKDDYIVLATEQMLANLPVQWMHGSNYLRWKGKDFEVKKKSFDTEQELVYYVKSLNRMIVCKVPHYSKHYHADGRVTPIYNSKPRKEYKQTKYILEYFDVNDEN